ncbi:MAG: hypothetical protein ACTS6G_03720 [Candidatus Hodgkinia cicadicola]
MLNLFKSNFHVWINAKATSSAEAEMLLKLLNFGRQLLPPSAVVTYKPGGSESLRLTSSLWCGGDLVKTCIIASEVNLSAGCNICFRMRKLPQFHGNASESNVSNGKNAFCVAKVNRMSLTNLENVFTMTQKPSNWLSLKLEMWNQNPPDAFERLIAQNLSAI